jgi:hypothetical protein
MLSVSSRTLKKFISLCRRVIRAYKEDTGSEPSSSVLARAMDELETMVKELEAK